MYLVKKVIIALSVLVVIVGSAGAGIAVKNHNDKEAVSLVNDAVSSAVSDALKTTETTTTTTTETTTEHTTTEPIRMQGSKLNTTTATTKKRTTTKKVTTTKRRVTTTTEEWRPKDASTMKFSSPDGDYWWTNNTRENPNETICVDENNRHFYFENGNPNTKRIYIN